MGNIGFRSWNGQRAWAYRHLMQSGPDPCYKGAK
jgi:hypothetical protein